MPWFPCPPCCASSSGGVRIPSACLDCGFLPDCFLARIDGVGSSTFGCSAADCDLLNSDFELPWVDPIDAPGFCAFGVGVLENNFYCIHLDPVICTNAAYDVVTLRVTCTTTPSIPPFASVQFELVTRSCTTTGASLRLLSWTGNLLSVGSDRFISCDALDDGIMLSPALTGGVNCDNASSTALILPCSSSLECCGLSVPSIGVSTGKALVAGVGSCVGPTNGDRDLVYNGMGAFNPCGGSNFPRGSMKWPSTAGPYLLEAFCLADHIALSFWYYTCNLDGSIGNAIVWNGTAALGTCDFSGIVLTLGLDSFGCADVGSTVTLHDFVL